MLLLLNEMRHGAYWGYGLKHVLLRKHDRCAHMHNHHPYWRAIEIIAEMYKTRNYHLIHVIWEQLDCWQGTKYAVATDLAVWLKR